MVKLFFFSAFFCIFLKKKNNYILKSISYVYNTAYPSLMRLFFNKTRAGEGVTSSMPMEKPRAPICRAHSRANRAIHNAENSADASRNNVKNKLALSLEPSVAYTKKNTHTLVKKNNIIRRGVFVLCPTRHTTLLMRAQPQSRRWDTCEGSRRVWCRAAQHDASTPCRQTSCLWPRAPRYTLSLCTVATTSKTLVCQSTTPPVSI